jgi:hypothetical protein
MTPEAQRILDVFKARGIKAGGRIHPADFGDAIIWEAGFVRDEPVRHALSELFSEGYLVELAAALELTDRGEKHLCGISQPKHGARVYLVGDKILIKQTVLRGTPPEYVIDEHRERHVRQEDDRAIAAAIRDAISGKL